MNKFNKKKDKLLIDLVKKNPVLYDPSNSNFKNCIVKHMVWENISSIMDIPVPDLKRRWKHFRDHFHKKQKAEYAGLATFHTWDYKPHLQFLVQYSNYKDKGKNNGKIKETEENKVSKTESAKEVTDEDSKEDPKGDSDDALDERAEIEEVKPEQVELDLIDEEMLESVSGLEEVSKMKRKKIDALAAVLENRLAKRFRTETAKSDKSPTHKFFESMADIVAQFPPHLVAETRLKVCQLVNEMEMNKQKNRENKKEEEEFL